MYGVVFFLSFRVKGLSSNIKTINGKKNNMHNWA